LRELLYCIAILTLIFAPYFLSVHITYATQHIKVYFIFCWFQ